MLKTNLAYENWASKYRYGEESPLQTWERVARALANTEKNPEEWYPKFLKTLVNFDETGEPIGLKCTPGGRITANIGTGFKGATLLNCFSGDTEYLDVLKGLVTFSEMSGKETRVLTKNGEVSAKIENFGVQKTYTFIFKPAHYFETLYDQKTGRIVKLGTENALKKISYRAKSVSDFSISVTATKNHRWLLVDNKETTDLKIGDIVESNVYDLETEENRYNKGFIHGLIYGDGSKCWVYTNAVNSSGRYGKTRFGVRLCGEKCKYTKYFEEKDILYHPSNEGDPTCYVESDINLKELPGGFDTAYIKGFIDGLIATDGCKLYENNETYEISTSSNETADWIKKYAFIAGYLVTGFRIDSNMETNYGPRKNANKRVILTKKTIKWKVTGILENEEQEVFCAVVPGEHSFTLANGLYTGNCFGTGPVSGAKITYSRHSKNNELSYPVAIKTSENPDDLFNIFLTIMEQAKTLASEGGYGSNFDWIRPRGSLIKGTGIKHPGVVAYMKVWDAVAECIVKGDKDGYTDKLKNYFKSEDKLTEIKNIVKKMTRKGAMLSALSSSHPDIEEYIRAKQTPGILTKFNTSVLIDDEFINAVEKDEMYELKFEGTVYKIVKARDLYDLIMESTYNRAEPGVIFKNNMQKNNPLSWLGDLLCTNPCGEVGINVALTTVCLLGSPNLTQYVEIIDGKPTFNWEKYKEDIKVFTRMLDNVCDLSNAPLPSYEWAIKNIRQFGMGLNGLGSTLMMLGIKYNSKEALAFTKEICSIKENLTWQTSALLAKEKGVFPAYNKEKFENTEYFKSDRITKETKDMLRKYGARNGKTTTCPPAGTTAIICDNTSNGIEPVFMLEYERKTSVFSWPDGLNTDNVKNVLKYCKKKDFEYWEGEYSGKKYYYEPHNRGLCEVTVIRDYGYQWLLDNFPNKDHSEYLSTTKDLTVNDHLDVQEIVQYYNNQSTSKTVNLPSKYPFSDFKKLYIDGWKRGLVGLTTYREGSMESVLSSIENASENKEIIKRDIKLPSEFINGPTKVVKKEGMKFYIHLSYLPDDTKMKHPVCIWIYTNSEEKGASVVCNKASRELAKLALKCGIDQKLIGSAIEKCKNDYPHNRLGRMISLCLRHNVPRADILVSLKGIEGDHISSLLTVVRKFIGETIENGTALKGVTCPNCGSDNIVMQAGCFSCKDCESIGCG